MTNNSNRVNNNSNKFDILYFNIRSLKKNIDEIVHFLARRNLTPNVLAISETWLGKNSFFKPKLPGYTYVNGNFDGKVGGVGFFIKNDISFHITTRHSLNIANCEELWIEVKNDKGSKKLFGIIYRHPFRDEITAFQTKFTELIFTLNNTGTEYFIFGDFNYCLMNNAYIDFVTNLLNLGCEQLIKTPTHPNPIHDSLLDHVYTNCCDKEIICEVIKEDITDHHLVYTQIKGDTISKYESTPPRITRCMKNFSEEAYSNDLSKKLSDFEQNANITEDDIDTLFQSLVDCLNDAINQHAPLKRCNKRNNKILVKPWISHEILQGYKTKRKLYHQKLRTKSTEDIRKYKDFSNKLTRMKEAAKVAYYHKLFLKSENNSKKTWKNINDVIRYKKSTVNTIDCIRDENDDDITNNTHIGNILNTYFVNIGNNLAKTCNTSHSQSLPTQSIPRTLNSFFLNPVTCSEINKLILNLDESKSNGPDQPQNKFIKIGHKAITPILTKLINRCFQSGIFPSILKKSTVMPIFKAGDRRMPTNYRPISLLPPFAKIIERCIHSRLTNFFIKNQIIDTNQYGFQKGISTEMAISKVFEELALRMDKKLTTCAIFLDIRKAFDSVNHEILIEKLGRYGIRGTPLKLLVSFLQNRYQSVFINGTKSEAKQIKCGVPQGSVLGPLLFLCFINDLPKVSSFFNTSLFADDACLISSSTSTTQLQDIVNNELIKISNWMATNKLCLNYEKTVFLTLTNQKSPCKLNVNINNNIITEVNHVKYLGVIFDKKLTWGPHIANVNRKIAMGSWAISNLKKYVEKKTLRLIYHALVYPHLHYGIPCWGSAAKYLLNKLRTKQNWILRVITNSKPQSHSTPLFHSMNILKLDDIYLLKVAIEMRKLIFNNSLHNYNIHFIQTSHNYQTRSSTKNNLSIPSINKNIGKASLKYKGPIIWNEVPAEYRNKNVSNFKFCYKRLLIDKYKFQE